MTLMQVQRWVLCVSAVQNRQGGCDMAALYIRFHETQHDTTVCTQKRACTSARMPLQRLCQLEAEQCLHLVCRQCVQQSDQGNLTTYACMKRCAWPDTLVSLLDQESCMFGAVFADFDR